MEGVVVKLPIIGTIENDDAGKVASNTRITITSQSAKDWRDRRQNPLFVAVRVDWQSFKAVVGTDRSCCGLCMEQHGRDDQDQRAFEVVKCMRRKMSS